ncbi:TetR/AcrR family transcriptional regulator C-terminal domain-containing protein [Actinoplanes sp. GCM10030250]|uniref:TetR/AcrR family transcriptional regulator C-terminal domain-containing protein n=1 Tax=Actinoplanes sp. GCM10030250 TaxID=3273376 RepID=UPI00360D9C39
MDPQTLTMQAVAQQLGVDRKTLHYHVSDREGLLELMALDALNADAGPGDLAASGDWRAVTRAVAHHMRNSLVRAGELVEYVRFPAASGLAIFAPVERCVEALLVAGFDEDQAARAVAFMAEFVFTSARDAIMIRRHGVHPQLSEISRVMQEADENEYGLLRRLSARSFQSGEAQFDFDLTVFVAGLDHLLAAKSSPGD